MSTPTRCDVCELDAQPFELAVLVKVDGGTGYVHLDHWRCIQVLLAEVPEPGEHDPPADFAAVRLRAERLAEVTGRPPPNLGEPTMSDGGIWHWVDPAD